MEISVGHTPDSDDAFMFYGMFTGKVPSPDFKVNHVIEDIEKLNRKATDPELDVTAVSVHACVYIPRYTILRSGGSFGIGYGPIVTAREQKSIDELKKCKICEDEKENYESMSLCPECGRIVCKRHVKIDYLDKKTPICEIHAKPFKLFIQKKYFAKKKNLNEYKEWWKKSGFFRRFYFLYGP